MKLKHSLFSFLLFIGALVLNSCVQKSGRSSLPQEFTADSSVVEFNTVEPSEDSIPKTQTTVNVAVYSEYPEGIDGCACYFGKTSSDLSQGKYIFMSNYDKEAYMELDGKMRTFELIESTNLEGGRLMERWKNKDYEMVVKSTESGQIDETWQNVGTINIKPTNQDATMINVVGECGC